MAILSIITSKIPDMLTKKYCLNGDKIEKQTGGQMVFGSAAIVEVQDIYDMGRILDSIKHNQALCYGIPKGGKVSEVKTIVPESEKKGAAISRTTKDFSWNNGSGVMFLDHDDSLTQSEFIGAVNEIMPELQTVDKCWFPSSSSFIYNGKEKITDLKGQRLYFIVDDATKIPEIGATLYKRSWLGGYGRIQISAAGSLLERSFVDATVWQCNRLDFASGALCELPLVQKRGNPLMIPGCRRQLIASDVKTITAEEERLYKQAVSDAKKPFMKQAETVQAGHIEKRLVAAPEKDRARLRELYKRAYQGGILAGDFMITLFEDGQPIQKTVAEILTDAALYDKCKTLDPIEPEYNDFHKTGMLFLTNGEPNLYSKAHGGRAFPLKMTMEKTESQIRLDKMQEQLKQQKSGDLFTVSLPWARLSMASCALAPATVTIIAGPAKAGKSFFVQNMIQDIHEKGLKWAYLPLEDDSTAWMWRMLAIIESDFTMKHTNRDTAEIRQEAFNRRKLEIESYMDCVTENPRTLCDVINGKKIRRGVSPRFVLDWIAEKAKTCRVVVVDPLVQIDFKGKNKWEAEEDFMREACGIVGDTNTSLILVCHTTKGSGSEASSELTVENLQGSASYGRLSHTVLMVDCIEEQEVDLSLKGGVVKKAIANRIVLIATARNGSGSRQKLAFFFEEKEPKFIELGFMAKKKKKDNSKYGK